MYAPSTLFFTAIMALARVAIATPPACLIAAMGAQTNPSDLKALCGTLEPQVAGNITEKCSGSAELSAMSIFSATCLASESVTITITSSSSSSSKTGSVSATTTGSGSTKAAATSSSVSKTTATGTATGTAASTGTTSSGSTASSTSTTSGSSLTSPQSAFFVAPLVLAVGLAGQYLL